MCIIVIFSRIIKSRNIVILFLEASFQVILSLTFPPTLILKDTPYVSYGLFFSEKPLQLERSYQLLSICLLPNR